MAADLEALAVGAGDHDRGVPADERADPALDLLVAGEPRLALGRDRVDVVGAAQGGHADLLLAGALEQPEHDVAGALAAALVDQRVERVEPLVGLVGVDVGQLGGQALVDHRAAVGAGRGVGGLGVSVSSLTAASLHAPEPAKFTRRVAVSRRATPQGGQVGTGLRRGGELRWTTPHLPHRASHD